MIGERVSRRSRVLRAIFALAANALLWIVTPSLLGSALHQLDPTSPLGIPAFVYAFGAAITGAFVLAALTHGQALSAVFSAGGYLAEAFYIWTATEGGNLSFNVTGVGIVLGIQPLVYLLMLPSLFSALRAPLTFLLDQSEVARPVPDEF